MRLFPKIAFIPNKHNQANSSGGGDVNLEYATAQSVRQRKHARPLFCSACPCVVVCVVFI